MKAGKSSGLRDRVLLSDRVIRVISGEVLIFLISAMTCGDGDLGDWPLPLPYPSQIGRRVERGHPRSSQIGVDLSDLASIGVGLRSFCSTIVGGTQLPSAVSWIPSDPDHSILLPPAFSSAVFKTKHLSDSTLARPRRDPCVTLGWPKGHPWVTQSQNPIPRLRQRVANRLLLASSQ